jgi:NADH dehydrogenase [ubiquinone] 1 alpha subcomplex assembly factor 1
MRSIRLMQPIVAVLVALLLVNSGSPAEAASTQLFAFSKSEPSWTVVNDGVMGGVSSSRVVTKAGVATFSGTVSLENNGGFASVRSNGPIQALPDDTTAFQLRVKGDGKTYQFTVDTYNGWHWAAITPVKAKWSTVTIPYADLVPVTRFGEPTERARFDATQRVSRIGLLISNKRAETFTISLDWVGVKP